MLYKIQKIVKAHYNFCHFDANLNRIIWDLKIDNNFCYQKNHQMVSKAQTAAWLKTLTQSVSILAGQKLFLATMIVKVISSLFSASDQVSHSENLSMEYIFTLLSRTTIAFVCTLIFYYIKKSNENVTKMTIKFERLDYVNSQLSTLHVFSVCLI